MLKDRKVFCLMALFLGFIELLILLLAPTFFMVGMDLNSEVIYMKAISFGGSFQLVKLNGYSLFDALCSLMGIVFITAIIVGMVNNFAILFAKKCSLNIATICYSISLAISIIYPVIIALKMGNIAHFVYAEFGYVSVILLILLIVFSVKGKYKKDAEEELDQCDTVDECDDSCSEE